MHGRQIFLPEQLYGQVRIHTDSDFNGTTRICGQIEYHRKTHNEYIYARVTKGMYGIPQSGRIAHGALVKTPRDVWIPPIKQKTQTMEAQQSPNKLYLGGR